MFNSQPHTRKSPAAFLAVLALVATGQRLAAQQTPAQFITSVESQISAVSAGLPVVNPQPLIFGGQDNFIYGFEASSWTAQEEIDYVDGLKAAGVQRVEFNPAVTSIDVASVVANIDVAVHHVRQLGMMLAINPEYDVSEFSVSTFSDFTNMAMQTYPLLAARYQPDNFVIVHEPTTMAARMGFAVTPAQWVAFINAVEPLIKAASPHTLVGAGDCSHCNEDAYFQAFVALPNCTATNLSSGCTDFVTDDDYSDSSSDFAEVEGWAELARTVGKPIYMEETFAPHDLIPGSSGFQGSPTGAEGFSLVGSCDVVFETLDQNWLLFMAQFDIAFGMESITPFTTETFFLYVNTGAPYDEATNPTYLREMGAYISSGTPQLTSTGLAYAAEVQQYGVKIATSISNASYATLPTIFNQSCGTGNNPCNPNSTVAPDMIVSAFGADLANTTVPASNWTNDVGGTTIALVDSTNASFLAPIYSVSPNQVNYVIPSGAAPGPAVLTITSGDKAVTTGLVLVAPVAIGLYTYLANGQGTAAAVAVCTGTCAGWPQQNQIQPGQYWQYTFTQGCTAEPCTAPLSWGPNDSLVIELYGTGIRHVAAASDILAGIGSTILQVQFAGAQGTDTGLDQVNVAIPQSLNGAGKVTLNLSVQYADPATQRVYTSTSNPVNLDLE
jgi:uncharacterized protein (TIGR03437 family)